MTDHIHVSRPRNERGSAARLEYLRVETQIMRDPVLKNALTCWLKEHRPVDWIIEQVSAHGVETTQAQLTAFSVRCGLAERPATPGSLIPWRIELHRHKRQWPYLMLAAESRLRAGLHNAPETLDRLVLWKLRLQQDGEVVDYQPRTREVWLYVPRRPGIDTDLIRVPNVR